MNNHIIDGYCINLEEAYMRKEHMKKEFDNSGINLNFFKAIKHEKGWIGALKSHLSLIKYAKENNMDYILVIEDDAVILDKNNFKNRLTKIVNYLKNNLDSWKIFSGGPWLTKYSKLTNYIKEENLLSVTKTYSATFMIYNKNVYDFFLKYLDIPDDKLIEKNAIDEIIHDNIPVLTQYPIMLWQKNNEYSYVLNAQRDDIRVLYTKSNYNFKRILKQINNI